MAINRLLAQMTISDLERAVEWYTRLFGRAPDARPMDALVEWHLTAHFGVQVWAEPDRSGHSTMVLDESDLDARVAQVDRAGLSYAGPRDITASRSMQMSDPDGNRIVFTGAFAG